MKGYGAEVVLAGWGAGGKVELPVTAIGDLPMDGNKLSGKVARSAVPVGGKYRGPRWPQATKATVLAPRAKVRNRILEINSMVKIVND